MDSLSARTIIGRAAISSPALLPPQCLKFSVSFRSAAAPFLGRSAGARSAGVGRISCAAVSVSTPVGGTDAAVSSAAAAVASKPTVLVSEKLGEAGLEVLRGFANELCAKISLCDALIVRSGTKVSREVFEAAKGRLKVVGRAGVGIDNVDLQAATEFGCLVVNAPTANTVAAAEHGIALMSAMARNVAQADASMKAGKWQRNKFVGVSLVGKTLAVLGFGKVGSEVARRAKLVSFDEAIATSDFISLHMPLTPTTAKIFNDETFAKVKKGVRIVNVARAALDVFTEEPPHKDSPLVQHPNVTVTPHLGASTVEAQEGVAIEIAEAVVGALNGELAATAVNAPMVPAEVLSELAPYVVLAEKLGRLAVQLVAGRSMVAGRSGIKGVKISYASARNPDDLDTRILRAMVTKGIVEPVSSVFVNLVNADFTAKQRGLRITEERHFLHGGNPADAPPRSRFASALSDSGEVRVEGRVKDGIPHLTHVGSFAVDVSLEGNLILCRQVDQPGMIGRVGNILGDDNVNVNYMSEPSKDTLSKIGDVPAIQEFVFLKL
ncbi:unnamed protein product [Spirodela intermedia]|uniref:phosphoglycerate dehydrogenase n=1 Tax=Spirodela intermedia TaxID=51605 RepID=A0A7I8JJF8_SPIIN|nr:unnamed protein product [Spirodela intermedia]CAA6670298.1 unnamed protein product [Spirodela intermedia]